MKPAFFVLTLAATLASCNSMFGVERPTWVDLPTCDEAPAPAPSDGGPSLWPADGLDFRASPEHYAFRPESPAHLVKHNGLKVFGTMLALAQARQLGPDAPWTSRLLGSDVPLAYYGAAIVETTQAESAPRGYVFAAGCNLSNEAVADAGTMSGSGCYLGVGNLSSTSTDAIPLNIVAPLPNLVASASGRAALVALAEPPSSSCEVGACVTESILVCYAGNTVAGHEERAIHCLRFPVEAGRPVPCSGVGCHAGSFVGLRGEILTLIGRTEQALAIEVTTEFGTYVAMPHDLQKDALALMQLRARFVRPPTAVPPAAEPSKAIAVSRCLEVDNKVDVTAGSDGGAGRAPIKPDAIQNLTCRYRRERPIAALDVPPEGLVWSELSDTERGQRIDLYAFHWASARTCARRIATVSFEITFDPSHVVSADGDGVLLALGSRLYRFPLPRE